MLNSAILAVQWHVRLRVHGEWRGVDSKQYFRGRTDCFEEAEWKELCVMDGVKNIWVVKAPETSCGIGIKLFHKLSDILECERGMGGRTVQKYVEIPLLTPNSSNNIPQQIKLNNSNNTNMFKFDLRIWVLVTSFQPLIAHIYSRLYGRRCGSVYSGSLTSLSDSYTHLTNYSVQKRTVKGGVPQSTSSGDYAQLQRQNTAKLNLNTTNNSTSNRTSAVNNDNQNDGLSDDDDDDAQSVTSESTTVSSAARKLRSVVSTYRSASPTPFERPESSAPNSDRRRPESAARDTATTSEPELLISHDEVVSIVENQYILNHQTFAEFGSKLVCIIQSNPQDATTTYWDAILWPEIKTKIAAMLEAAQDRVTHRDRSYELLGYDVLIDSLLTPRILEANMSPAMAHRNPQQSSLIAEMCKGLVELAIVPHVAMTSGEAIEECYCAPALDSMPNKDHNGSEEFSSQGGQWESLITPSVVITAQSAPVAKIAPKITLESLVADSTNDQSDINYSIVSPGDDWRTESAAGALRPKMVRPKSANSAVRRRSTAESFANSGSGSGKVSFNGMGSVAPTLPAVSTVSAVGLDSSYVLVGRAISNREIIFADVCCKKFDKVLSIQSWSRRHLLRLRFYHWRRREAVVYIQCMARMHNSRRRVLFVRRLRAVVVIQSVVRRRLACRRVKKLRIQCGVRRYIVISKSSLPPFAPTFVEGRRQAMSFTAQNSLRKDRYPVEDTPGGSRDSAQSGAGSE
eukprot:gene24873-31262_t